MIDFDEKLIIKEAEGLYKKARSIVVYYAFLCFVAGFITGYIAANKDATVSMIIGIIGLLCGIAAGSAAGQKLKFNAQMLLCQLQIERNTRKN